MKAPVIISIIFFLVLAVVANIYFLKLTIMPFIGILLLALLILGLIVNFSSKYNKKRKGVQGEPNAFIFPDKAAKKMKNMSLGVQYEASVISSTLLILGIIFFLIYFTFFTTSSWMMKGLVIFNSICGIIMMGSMLVTFYQQLIAYRESTKLLTDFAKSKQNKVQQLPPEPEYIQPEYESDPDFIEQPLEDEYYNNQNINYNNLDERRFE